MTSKLVAFIIGAGAGIGSSVAAKLQSKGYKVALGSRNPKPEEGDYFPVKVDAEDRASIVSAFETVTSKLGPVNVVIYNAASIAFPPKDLLSLPAADYYKSIEVGLGAFTAAQEALKGFRSDVHKSNPKAFIVTGNALPFIFNAPMLAFHTLGLQKTLEARFIATAAAGYAEEGIKFYYASLVSKDLGFPGMEVFQTSGPVHAEVYWDLINTSKQEEWDQRFTIDGERLPQKTA